MFEWLFKYPLEWYARGDVQLAWTVPAWIGASLILIVLCYLLLNYSGLRHPLPGGRHATVWLLRGLLLSVLLFVLLSPTLVTEVEESVHAEVAVLIDQSQSMSIVDSGSDTTRLSQALSLLDPSKGELSDRLNESFNPRFIGFGQGARPLTDNSTITATQGRSNLVGALNDITSAGAGDLPSAIIVASDGGFDAYAGLTETIDRLKALGIALHTVTVGDTAQGTDIELNRVSGPTRVLRGDSVELDLTVRHTGLAGRNIVVALEEDGRIITEQTLTVPDKQSSSRLQFRLPLDAPGVRRLELVARPEGDETQLNNNRLVHTVVVRDTQLKVLHFEGEPRFEVKFARRALGDDDSIRLASLIRTAENKYWRLGIANPEELADGFPTTREQLFKYDVLILGSVDADLLDTDQQQLVQQFVDQRGGGLLLLGGARAFARGGFAGQPLETVMPVVLEKKASAFRRNLTMTPTLAGRRHALLQIARNETQDEMWQRLPPLTVINPLYETKPAATVLLTAEDASGDELVVMAEQPYGRGRVIALAVRNTWRWQMDSELPAKDPTHELLWRQMIRWLSRNVDQRVQVSSSHERAVTGDTVTLTMEAYDTDYRPDSDANIEIQLTDPAGTITSVRAVPDSVHPGRFTAQFAAEDEGHYEIETILRDAPSASNGESVTQSDSTVTETTSASTDDTLLQNVMRQRSSVYVSQQGDEFIDAASKVELMQSLATRSGGRSFTLDDANALPDALTASLSTRSTQQRLSLWNAPIWMIVILLLACLEWLLRRRWTAA